MPITLRIGDGNAQPDEQLEEDAIRASNKRMTTYGQRLARKISVRGCIDPAEGTEPILASSRLVFPGKLIIERRDEAICEASQGRPDLEYWCDGSKLDTGGTGAPVVWKTNRNSEEWQELKISLGQNKEIFDAKCGESPKLLRLQNRGPDRYNIPWPLVYFATLRQLPTTGESAMVPEVKH